MSFQGVGLYRANGDLVVLHDANVTDELRLALKLTDAEVKLLARVQAEKIAPLSADWQTKCVRLSDGSCDETELCKTDCESVEIAGVTFCRCKD